MAGLWTRIKNWIPTEILTAAALNAEFNNVIANQIPEKFDDHSANVAQMQETFDPGEVGTENLPTNLAEEIKGLRHQMVDITGEAEWYESPDASLATLSGLLGTAISSNRIVSGRAEANSSLGTFLEADGSTNTVHLRADATDFVYRIGGIEYTISADVNFAALVQAPSSNNTCLVDDATMTGQQLSKIQGEDNWNGSTSLGIKTIGSEISSLAGEIAAFKVGAEYFIAKVETSSLTKCFRGYFFDDNSAAIPRVGISDGDTITLMKLAGVFANADGSLAVTYNNVRAGGTAPSGPSTGDRWFDTSASIWKEFDSSSWIDAESILIGICIQDATNTVAARSGDFFKAFSDRNTVELDLVDATEVRSKIIEGRVDVYGSPLKFEKDYIRWDMDNDLDGGLSEAADTIYYKYIKESGAITISDVAPHNRKNDLLGQYHPHHAWRCVGEINNDSGSDFDASTIKSYGYSISEGRFLPGTIVPNIADGEIAIEQMDSTITGNSGNILHVNMAPSGPTIFTGATLTINNVPAGRLIEIYLLQSGAGTSGFVSMTTADTPPLTAHAFFQLKRTSATAATLANINLAFRMQVATDTVRFQPFGLMAVDSSHSGGTVTYELQGDSTTNETLTVSNCYLFAKVI